ncbi:MAG: RluA family pseudouridine synthase [Bacteroidales bacterium]|nr:RluA family pseudouridine synthase [Bacteroidales bacterium]
MTKELKILYEDNHLIVVNKAISDIVQGDKTGDESLDKKIKSFIKLREKKPGNVYLGIPHRLDRPVSGAIVYTKTSKALERVNEIFREGTVEKIYHAIVKEKPNPDSGKLENYLRKNEKQNKSYITAENAKGAKLAKLEYKLIATSDNYNLLEIKLLTGKHHQIRVQLSNIGCPIKGDLKYGFPRSNKNGGISLHARSISFTHPIKKEALKIEAPYPEGDIFGVF